MSFMTVLKGVVGMAESDFSNRLFQIYKTKINE